MKTVNKKITMNILVPSAGHMLTQTEEVEPKDRIFSEEIYLAVNDSVDNWKEVTIEEAEKLRKELQEEKELPAMEEPWNSRYITGKGRREKDPDLLVVS